MAFVLAREAKLNVSPQKSTLAHCIDKLFEPFVEPNLVQPTIVTQYPIELSPLAKRKEDDPNLTYRFELFICGSEIANAFSELNDPDAQRSRFEPHQALKDLDDEAHGLLPAEGDDRRVVGAVQRDAFANVRDPRIAGRAPERVAQRRLDDFPSERMFAAAASDQEDVHGRAL